MKIKLKIVGIISIGLGCFLLLLSSISFINTPSFEPSYSPTVPSPPLYYQYLNVWTSAILMITAGIGAFKYLRLSYFFYQSLFVVLLIAYIQYGKWWDISEFSWIALVYLFIPLISILGLYQLRLKSIVDLFGVKAPYKGGYLILIGLLYLLLKELDSIYYAFFAF